MRRVFYSLPATQGEGAEPQSVRLKVTGEAVDIPNNYVFVFSGGVPPFDFLKEIEVRFGGE